MPAWIDDSDVQGLVRFGYGDMTEACFYLLEVRDRAAARAWLGARAVTTAVKVPRTARPEKALQVAFSWDGLKALGLPPTVEGFSLEFISGMAGDESRSRRLGDLGASAPSTWYWGAPGRVPHVLVMLYAARRAPGELEAGDPKRPLGGGVPRDTPVHLGPGQRRALRLQGRDQPARARLGARARDGRRRSTLHQSPGARRVPARLPQRVREIHRAPAAARER